jgi:hypothetical protein
MTQPRRRQMKRSNNKPKHIVPTKLETHVYHKGNRETTNDLGCLFVIEGTMQIFFYWDEFQFVHRAGFQFVGEGNVSDTRDKGNDLGFIELGKMEKKLGLLFIELVVKWKGKTIRVWWGNLRHFEGILVKVRDCENNSGKKVWEMWKQ